MSRLIVVLTVSFLSLAAGGCGGGSGGDGESSAGVDASVGSTPASSGGSSGDEPSEGNNVSETTDGLPAVGEDPFAVEGSGGGTDEGPVPGEGGATVPDAEGDAAASMGDDGPEDQAPVGETDDTAALAGFWDYTRSTEAGTDVAAFAIGPDGTVDEYDYRGDAAGDGRDCHALRATSIASRGEDRYDIQGTSFLPGADSIDDVLITVADGEITFRYLGDVFDPEFGAGQAGITETYPAITDRRPEELAVCEG